MRRTVLWPAGLAIGIAAEWAGYGWSDIRYWLPDLVAGWSLIACGLVARERREESRTGPLLALTGFVWFAGNFASGIALSLYRGPLVHTALTYPRGRVRGRLEAAAIVAGYAAAFVTAVWRSGIGTAVVAVVLIGTAGHGYLTASGRERRERFAAVQATAGLAIILAIGAVHVTVPSTSPARYTTLVLYDLGLAVLALGFLLGLLAAPWARGMSDLVVELGEMRSWTLRDELARALGDPTLRVGYRLPSTGEYVDADGRRLELAVDGDSSAVTYLERDGERVAALVHDPALLDDPDLVAAVAAATQLAASNARLQADVRARLEGLEDARRRLVESRDRERGRLEERLRGGAERRLLDIGDVLDQARVRQATDGTTGARIESASAQLERTLASLRDLARGLHPRLLADEGLDGALGVLASRSPLPVTLSLPAQALPAPVEAAVYFVCAESLANVIKYAQASTAAVTVTVTDGIARVVVSDDGVGGADPARGTGLAGLADRVEAIGGTLRVTSSVGAGTLVSAEIPVV